MSSQADDPEFITTIKELMRLTREGELRWTVDHSPSSFRDSANKDRSNRLPTYATKYDDLEFRIEDASSQNIEMVLSNKKSKSKNYVSPGNKYRIVITDKSDSSTISSPPMKQIEDLVSVIEKKPRKDKLRDINEKLSGI